MVSLFSLSVTFLVTHLIITNLKYINRLYYHLHLYWCMDRFVCV